VTQLARRGEFAPRFVNPSACPDRSGSALPFVEKVRFNAQQAGVYYIAVKFQTGNVGGDPAPAPGTTVHYDFSTTGVPGSTSGVDLVKQ
jgi:hypothetical protein